MTANPTSGASGRTHHVDAALAASHHAALDGLDYVTGLTTLLSETDADNTPSEAATPTTVSPDADKSENSHQTTLVEDVWATQHSGSTTPSLVERFRARIQPAPDFLTVRHPEIPMVALPLELSGRAALVGCGNKKEPGVRQARDLYASTYFAKKRAFAETFCDSWTICSAKYGLLSPYRRIPSYDVTDSDIHAATWLEHIDTQLSAHLRNDRVSELWVLLGTPYLSLAPESGGPSLRDRLEALPCKVYFPFDETAGIGYQMGWVNTCLEQKTAALPSELE